MKVVSPDVLIAYRLLPVKNFAQRHGVVVIATIHQPNWETFSLFDKLLLLSQGRQVYYGPIGK